MFIRRKFAFVTLVLPLILGAQTGRAESDHNRHKKEGRRHGHRYHGQHHRQRSHRPAHCARNASSARSLEKLPEDSFLSFFPPSWGPATPQPHNYPLSGFNGLRTCSNTMPILAQMMPPSRAMCFARLFYKENNACSIHTLISPAQGNNPHWGIGLCTIELSPVLRKTRPAACANLKSMDSQVACCVGMYEQTRGRYFGPINRGEVPRC